MASSNAFNIELPCDVFVSFYLNKYFFYYLHSKNNNDDNNHQMSIQIPPPIEEKEEYNNQLKLWRLEYIKC